MGQYYKACFLNAKKTKPTSSLSPYDFGCGAKLMEHSWMLNPFVGYVERFLINNPTPLVWAGDYADNEPINNIDSSFKSSVVDALKKEDKEEIKLGGEANYVKTFLEKGMTLYELTYYQGVKIIHDEEFKKDGNKYNHVYNKLPKRYKYIVNHDKKVFIDKTKVPADGDGWRVHPLPLMTCSGNGRGGGDYRGEEECIGTWARDVISIESKRADFPKDYTEFLFNIIEK